MNKNSFLKQFAIIGSGTFINMVLGVFSTPIITRIVLPEEYGQLSIFMMYTNIAVMVLCIGLDQALVRYYYEYDNIDEKKALLIKCIKLPMMISLIASILLILLVAFHIINIEFDTSITILLCINILDQIIFRFSQLIVRLEKNAKLYSLLQIIQKLVYIVVAVSLCIFIKKYYVYILVGATTLSYVVCLFVSIFSQKDIWSILKVDNSLCTVKTKELLAYSAPFILSMGITTIFQALDKISLNHFKTYYEVGIYASTMTLVHVFAIVQTSFNALWAPMSVEHYTKYPQDTNFHKHANQVITVVMFFLGITLILVKDIFAIMLGEKYREAAYILPFLIFNPIMYTISETTVCGLVFKKKSNLQVVVAVGACITNAIGNYILVPMLGCQGAAISTGISYIVFYYLRTILGQRYFYVDFRLRQFTLITIAVSAYAFYNTFFSFSFISILGYIVCLFLLMLTYRETMVWIVDYLVSIVKLKMGIQLD